MLRRLGISSSCAFQPEGLGRREVQFSFANTGAVAAASALPRITSSRNFRLEALWASHAYRHRLRPATEQRSAARRVGPPRQPLAAVRRASIFSRRDGLVCSPRPELPLAADARPGSIAIIALIGATAVRLLPNLIRIFVEAARRDRALPTKSVGLAVSPPQISIIAEVSSAEPPVSRPNWCAASPIKFIPHGSSRLRRRRISNLDRLRPGCV
jgi:hypothetical protein